jgi:hypothetical protein
VSQFSTIDPALLPPELIGTRWIVAGCSLVEIAPPVVAPSIPDGALLYDEEGNLVRDEEGSTILANNG